MLHGWGMASTVWHAMRNTLDPGIEVVAPDLPGYGIEAKCTAYDLARIVADLRACHGGQSILCGWSMGGLLAQYWAALYPREVHGLVLLSSTPRFVAKDDWSHGMDLKLMSEFGVAVASDVGAALMRFSALQAQGDVHARAVMRRLREVLSADRMPASHTLMDGLELLRETDLRACSGAIRSPTLIIHGRQDRVCPVSAAEWLSGAISGASLSIHEGASHAVFLSDPGRVGSEISAFVKSIHARTGQA